jgi:hypothetical protein
MADIKQAVRWMQEGKKVKRAIWKNSFFYTPPGFVSVMDETGVGTNILTNELLADDWQIVEEANDGTH